MKASADILMRLEKLKNMLLLDSNGCVCCLKTWTIEDVTHKPLFGKKVTEKVITKLWFKSTYNMGTKYYGVVDKNLSEYLCTIEDWRSRMITIRAELEKFGFAIKSLNHFRR